MSGGTGLIPVGVLVGLARANNSLRSVQLVEGNLCRANRGVYLLFPFCVCSKFLSCFVLIIVERGLVWVSVCLAAPGVMDGRVELLDDCTTFFETSSICFQYLMDGLGLCI